MSDKHTAEQGELPPLPEPFMELHRWLSPYPYDAWAAQMREYARDAAIASAKHSAAQPAEGSAPAPTFPERDESKPTEQQGLFRKFDVRRVDGSDQPGGKHYGCRYYVLDLTHDQHAAPAMRAYAAACRVTHPQLADDIETEFGAPERAAAPADIVLPGRLDEFEETAEKLAYAPAITNAYARGWNECLGQIRASEGQAQTSAGGWPG